MNTVHHDMTIKAGEDGRASVTVTGEVDASNSDRLRLAILEAAGAGQPGARLEVDLAGITFMDSTGLLALADASHALQPGGSGLVLRNVPRQVGRLLAITDIAADIDIDR